MSGAYLLLGLEVLEEDGTFLALFTPVTDNDAGAVDDLARVSFTVKDAYITQTHQLAMIPRHILPVNNKAEERRRKKTYTVQPTLPTSSHREP